MLLALFFAHVAAALAVGLVGRRSQRAALALAALMPAVTASWAARRLLRDSSTATANVDWVAGLDLSVTFRMDAVAELMTLLVSGIGALVFVYAIGYFGPSAGTGSRFPATLLAFSTSMLGLIWADSVWTLFIFWELTSITSFLLVGHKHQDAEVRKAARRALLITGAGGLALLAGLLVMVDLIGGASLSALEPLTGTKANVAALLVLAGAATKSAQVPFHVWLPGAMAAPTPVSAYLHSATMVKAGVLLAAVASPALSTTGSWKVGGAVLGIASMMWGAIGALRHRDAKLILAWGTVSQLGLMMTLFTLGTAKATFAGMAILFAHALFKATLFLVVGEVDVRTGTRDIASLRGLWRSMPIACAMATAAGLSMAGVPPLLGFMAKEAAIEASIGLDGVELALVGGAIIVGSVLTVAYTTRFLLGVFGGRGNTEVTPRRWAMTAPATVLGLSGVAFFVFVDAANRVVGEAASEIDPSSSVYALIQWPGLKTAFVISALVVAVGAALGAVLVARSVPDAPPPLGAQGADALIDGVLSYAPRFTARIQHGSLPVYVAVMGLAATLGALPFLRSLERGDLVWWDHPFEPVVAVAVVGSALSGTLVRSRLGAALTLGAVGLGVSALFVIRSAPDLALTQLLVETIVVVGFVLGLGRLGNRFPVISGGWQAIRVAIAIAGGAVITGALASASASPAGEGPVVDQLVAAAVDEGGGKNVVNVILTDLRALDTLGEVTVLATVAVGLLALARLRRMEVTS